MRDIGEAEKVLQMGNIFEGEDLRSGPVRSRCVRHRTPLLLIFHVFLFAGVFATAFSMRFDFRLPDEYQGVFWRAMPFVISVKLFIFIATSQLHGWLRIVSFRDLISIMRACVFCLISLAACEFFITRLSVPKSVLLFDTMLTLISVGGMRSSWRLFAEFVRPRFNAGDLQRTAIVGLNDESIILASQIQSYGHLSVKVCGLIALNAVPAFTRSFRGLPILGSLADLHTVVRERGIQKVLVHTESLSGQVMRHLMDTCNRLGIDLQIVAKFEQRMDGGEKIPVRDIKIDDLLRRETADMNLDHVRDLIANKSILVTGAGGSIGSEICRQILAFGPKRLVLLGRGENRIFDIDQELKLSKGKTSLENVIADIRDRERMEQVFADYSPDVVFHAAAHKHVPLMEQNPREAVTNNVLGTCSVVDAAAKSGVSTFVMISSDKAVRPSSIMGGTKRLAEMYVAMVSRKSETRFMSVRFGNVLGSAGSVVQLFKRQIERGGPITVTDKRMTRFFMTIPEASQLVLQAAATGTAGGLFMLDMGEPVKIVDLARDLIRLSGLPEDAIEIVFSKIRPGEKLHEELAENAGDIKPTGHPKIKSIDRDPFDEAFVNGLIDFVSSPLTSVSEIREILVSLKDAPPSRSTDDAGCFSI